MLNSRNHLAILRRLFILVATIVTCLSVGLVEGQERLANPEATRANFRYGPHERHRLDFWAAESEQPTPLVVYVHGGGFRSGSKEDIEPEDLLPLLESGISVASVEYRFLEDAPLPAAHEDCRRALQTIRHHAAEWGIDKHRVGAYGGSAGAQIVMWLAFHDEMANPFAVDSISRESTRLTCVANRQGQTTLDFSWWKEHIPGYDEPHRPARDLFGDLPPDRLQQAIDSVSALSLLSADDPPIWMMYRMNPDDPIPGADANPLGWKVHHVNFGIGLEKLARKMKVEADLSYPRAKPKYASLVEFFRVKLLAPKSPDLPAGILQVVDFESGQFDGFILSGNEQKVVENPDGQGKVFRAYVPRDDQRSEIALNDHRIGDYQWQGKTHWYAWSIYLSEDFRPAETHTILAQWHRWQPGMRDRFRRATGHPNVFAIDKESGQYFIHFSYQPDPQSHPAERKHPKTDLESPTYEQDRGKWVQWAAKIKWSSQDDGHVEIYRNGRKVATYAGANYLHMPLGPNFKCGIYTGNPWKGGPDSLTAFVDNVIVGDELCDLDAIRRILSADH